VERLGFATGYARNFLSQATLQGLLIAESRKGKKEKTFKANPNVVRAIVLRGAGVNDISDSLVEVYLA